MSPNLPIKANNELSNSRDSGLCAMCGLCCDGTLFYSVELQPKDSPKQLIGLGLKLQKKRKHNFLLQPCSAFCGDHCSIYEYRPERCRAFACAQLLGVQAGTVSRAEAEGRIVEAKAAVTHVNHLFQELGEPHQKRNILRRYDAILARVPDASEEAKATQLKGELTMAIKKMEEILQRYFRINVAPELDEAFPTDDRKAPRQKP